MCVASNSNMQKERFQWTGKEFERYVHGSTEFPKAPSLCIPSNKITNEQMQIN